MTPNSLLQRNLVYHGRSNLAVLLATAIGTAVLVGALMVGDSLRGSLRRHAEDQLNGIDQLLIAPRFFREIVAQKTDCLPVLFLQGNASRETETIQRAGKVAVLGVPRLPTESEPLAGVALSRPLADQLKVKEGDSFQLGVQKASAVPRSSILGRRGASDSVQSITLKVGRILPADHPGNLFQLNPSPGVPLNLFVPLKELQAALQREGHINALFAWKDHSPDLQQKLVDSLDLDDWGLKVQIAPKRKDYISVESTRLLLEPAVAEAARKAAEASKMPSADTLVYLATALKHGKEEIPYSIIAGLDPTKAAPLGPFLPAGATELKEDEIVLVDWRESPLKAKPGDTIEIEYFLPEIEGEIKRATASFKLKGIIPLEGVADDPDLTPAFPGITDKLSLSNWDPPFPYESSRVKSRDENYWRRYKTTPKAYINLAAARKLFASRFGDTTSIRIALPPDWNAEAILADYRVKLLHSLDPKAGGFSFEPIRDRLLKSSVGSNDFGMLFLAFSFFLIVAALLLVGLMFRLNVERRAKELGLLEAVGFSPHRIRRMLTTEGLILSGLGGLLGLIAAIGFAGGMLWLLKVLWPDGSVGSFLSLHISFLSPVIGFIASVSMSLFAIRWALRILKISPAQLLKGATAQQMNQVGDKATRTSLWFRLGYWGTLLVGVGCMALGPFLPPGEPQAGSFFSGGFFLLLFFMALFWSRLKKPLPAIRSLGTLAWTNTTRNPTRSLLTAGLLASAVFLLVAVESFRRQPEADFAQKDGGSGGFSQILELDVPLFAVPGTSEFQDNLLAGLRKVYQNRKLPAAEIEAKLKPVEEYWDPKRTPPPTIYPFRVKAGDDASCLNLFQATNPKVLGASREFIDRGGFTISDQIGKGENAWLLLNEVEEGKPVPAMVEENTATWMLKKGLGDTFDILDENGQPFTVKLVAFLKDSPFQSEILISDSAFLKHYPRQEGYGYFLLDLPPEHQEELQAGLAAYGPTLSNTKDRVANYLAVENTYLTTFQLLGWLGMLLGILGLSAVLLRNILERRGELALLSALGYSPPLIRQLLNRDNIWLLASGLVFGLIAALISILPAVHLTQVPWLRLGTMVLAVLAVGIVVVRLAVASALRERLVSALGRE